jgi:hypothetical protein
LALFLNLAIGSSAHFRKSKTQVGAFGKKMSVRQKTTWDASGQTSCAKRDAGAARRLSHRGQVQAATIQPEAA